MEEEAAIQNLNWPQIAFKTDSSIAANASLMQHFIYLARWNYYFFMVVSFHPKISQGNSIPNWVMYIFTFFFIPICYLSQVFFWQNNDNVIS